MYITDTPALANISFSQCKKICIQSLKGDNNLIYLNWPNFNHTSLHYLLLFLVIHPKL